MKSLLNNSAPKLDKVMWQDAKLYKNFKFDLAVFIAFLFLLFPHNSEIISFFAYKMKSG